VSRSQRDYIPYVATLYEKIGATEMRFGV